MTWARWLALLAFPLVLALSPGRASAAFSDILSVFDTQGFGSPSAPVSVSLSEEMERAGTTSISIPFTQAAGPIMLNDSTGVVSDMLIIDPFTVTFTSDATEPKPPATEPRESTMDVIRVIATSSDISGVSDTIAVGDTFSPPTPKDLLEADETQTTGAPRDFSTITATFPGRTITAPFFDNGDTLTIPEISVRLRSDIKTSASESTEHADSGMASVEDDITIFAGSDVPEPSTLILLSTGLAGLFVWRRRKQAICRG